MVAQALVCHCGCWWQGEYLGGVYSLDLPRDDPGTLEIEGVMVGGLIHIYINGQVVRVQAWNGEETLRLDLHPGLSAPATLPEVGGKKAAGEYSPPIERPN